MGKTYSGYTSTTADNLLLDAGAFFINFNIDTDDFDSAVIAGKLLGATRGGGEFSAEPSIRSIEVDGAKGVTKGLQVIDSWAVKMSASVLEVSKEGLSKALLATNVDTVTNLDFDIITAKNTIELTDYIDNVTFVGHKSGTVEPVVIQIYNALNTSGLKLQTQDKGEAVIAMEFVGHYSDTDLETPPFSIFYPKA